MVISARCFYWLLILWEVKLYMEIFFPFVITSTVVSSFFFLLFWPYLGKLILDLWILKYHGMVFICANCCNILQTLYQEVQWGNCILRKSTCTINKKPEYLCRSCIHLPFAGILISIKWSVDMIFLKAFQHFSTWFLLFYFKIWSFLLTGAS